MSHPPSHPLLLEIQRFAVGKNAFHREELPEGEIFLETLFEFSLNETVFSATQLLVKNSLKLLEELPVLRDSIFDYYSMIFEVSIANYIKLEVSTKFLSENIKHKISNTEDKRK